MSIYTKLKNYLIQIKKILDDILFYSKRNIALDKIQKDILENKITLGRILSNLNLNRKEEIINNIHLSEFKIFSQWGDDGIINFLVNYLDIKEKTFIEFGVENYTECNTRFLLVNDNWKGLIIDGSENNINSVKNDDIYWKYDLTAIAEFITQENINSIFIKNNFIGEIGILHIDIDGNDYWIWKKIDTVNPIIVIVEYNSIFGNDKPYTIPYKSDFIRTEAHFSNLYYGTSLLSICDLANEKGYSFIGCNSNGNNAYFVRKDKMKELKELMPSEGYVLSKFAESRNKNGDLIYLRGNNRLDLIKGLQVFNTRSGKIEEI